MNPELKIPIIQLNVFADLQLMDIKIKIFLKKTGERFGINAIGFQGIGTTSAIFFNNKNNANNFAITLGKYQITRVTNPKAIELLNNAINNPNLDITNIKLELLYGALGKEEYEKLFDDDINIDYDYSH